MAKKSILNQSDKYKTIFHFTGIHIVNFIYSQQFLKKSKLYC